MAGSNRYLLRNKNAVMMMMMMMMMMMNRQVHQVHQSISSNINSYLTLVWVGFLEVRFEVGGIKLPPPPPACLKPVRIMLETSNLARKCTLICSFIKYTFQCLGLLNFADVSILLQKISVFCPKKYNYSKQQCESCVRDF